MNPFRRPRWWTAYSFVLATGLLFLLSWYGQFLFQAREFVDDAHAHGHDVTWADYLPSFVAATLENWQSEFLQLMWQVAGLAWFYHWGSSQSRESDARVEAKVDLLLREQGIEPDTLR